MHAEAFGGPKYAARRRSLAQPSSASIRMGNNRLGTLQLAHIHKSQHAPPNHSVGSHRIPAIPPLSPFARLGSFFRPDKRQSQCGTPQKETEQLMSRNLRRSKFKAQLDRIPPRPSQLTPNGPIFVNLRRPRHCKKNNRGFLQPSPNKSCTYVSGWPRKKNRGNNLIVPMGGQSGKCLILFLPLLCTAAPS